MVLSVLRCEGVEGEEESKGKERFYMTGTINYGLALVILGFGRLLVPIAFPTLEHIDGFSCRAFLSAQFL